jgi:phi13 family phage major tail protein
MANKIKYGLKNVYYAVATIADDGSATFATPVKFPGAVSLSMDAQGEVTPFYADNIKYYVGVSNNGYEGDLEMALITNEFKKEILGYVEDSNHVLYEDAAAEAVHFALIFQFEGDKKATRHVLYNCTATRPAASGSTKQETVEPQTETVTISAGTIFVPALELDIPKASTTEETTAAIYDAWFTNVYIPGAAA